MSSNLKLKSSKTIGIDELVKETHFNKMEIENLTYLHKTLAKSKLDRMKFREFLYNHFNLTDDLIMDRIFKVFDRNNDGYVSNEEWLFGLSTFLRGTLDEQVKFCFDLYDLNNDGHITKDEVYSLLKKSVVRQINEEDPDDAIKELVDLVIKKLDKDNDHRISQKDLKRAVNEEQLLMQCLGTCLPDIKMIKSFEERYLNGSSCLRQLI